jgi:hypothetical protein
MPMLAVTQILFCSVSSVWSAVGNRRPTECLQNTGGASVAALMYSVSLDINERVEGKILGDQKSVFE